jgi:hypothetical protein
MAHISEYFCSRVRLSQIYIVFIISIYYNKSTHIRKAAPGEDPDLPGNGKRESTAELLCKKQGGKEC